MERRICVPEGMLKAGMMARNAAFMGDEGRVKDILEAAIRWLAENPIVPTDEQAQCLWTSQIIEGNTHSDRELARLCAVEWQRRMFLAPEPEDRVTFENFDGKSKRVLLDGEWLITLENRDAERYAAGLKQELRDGKESK